MAAFLMAFELNLYFQVKKVKKKIDNFSHVAFYFGIFRQVYLIKIDMSGNTF